LFDGGVDDPVGARAVTQIGDEVVCVEPCFGELGGGVRDRLTAVDQQNRGSPFEQSVRDTLVDAAVGAGDDGTPARQGMAVPVRAWLTHCAPPDGGVTPRCNS
jgi:hypothetical protein